MSEASESKIDTGVLKFTNHERGFSFIKPDWPGPDIFCHSSVFKLSGINTAHLNPDGGERVAYEIQQRAKGPAAVNIRLLKGGELA